MSLHINSDKEKFRGVNPKLIGDNELTIRGGVGALEREILRTELDTATGLPRVGINRTGQRINNIDVTAGGTGYTTQPSVTVAPPGTSDGITALASAFIFNGKVVSIAVNNPGYGYTTAPTVTLSGGGGSGATATAVLDTVDYELDINGAIRTSTSIISDTARILNLDIDNFVTPDANLRGPNLKTYQNNTGTPWAPNVIIQKDSYRYFGANVYQATNAGQTGSDAPTHADGIVLNGEVLFKHIGFHVVDQLEFKYGETGEAGIFPRSITPILGDRSDKIATTEYVLNLATNDVGGRVYVSAQIGSDLNDGRSAVNPVRSIKKACQLAWATPGVKETIIVSGGDYVEDNPVSIPPDASIVGDNLRLVIIRPANPGKHMFKFGDKNYVLGVTFRDQIDSNGDPVATWDYAMVFDDKQRIQIDVDSNGDVGTSYPIGHQIFGPDQFRVDFQQNTGLSTLVNNLEVVGVNTGARAKVIDVNFTYTTGASAYVAGKIDVNLTSGSFVEGERFEYITSAGTGGAISLTMSQTAGSNKIRFTQDPGSTIPAGTYVFLDDTNDTHFTQGYYQVIAIDNTNSGSGYWDVTFVPILNAPTWDTSASGTFTIAAATPNIETIDTTSIKSIRAEGEVVSVDEDYTTTLPISRIDFSLQGDASIATGGFQNAQFGNAEDVGGIIFYTNALVGRTNTHEFKEGQEILISGLPTSGPNLSELNGKQRIYKVLEDNDGRCRRFVIPKKMPAVVDPNLNPGQFAAVKTATKTVTLSLLNSPNSFPLSTPSGRRYQDASILIRNNRDYIADEAVGRLNSQFAKSYFATYEIGGTAASTTTPTGATYDPATGDLVFTKTAHGFSVGTGIRITDSGLTFTCAMDSNATEHAYPRSTDPATAKALPITSKTNDTFTVNVGISPANVEYTPTAATYNAATGDLTLTLGTHSLSTGESITIDNDSLHFKCAMDNNQVTKKYPRALKDQSSGRSLTITGSTATSVTVNVGAAGTNRDFTPTGATYDPATGVMVLTVGQHGVRVGDSVVIDNDALTFTCAMDGHATKHAYPRLGTDPTSGQAIEVTAVGETSHTVTGATYTPATGILQLTIAGHGFANGDYIKLDDDSLKLTCALDSNGSNHDYPRAGYDKASGRWLVVGNVQTNTFDINVGISSDTSVHTFVSAVSGGLKRQDGTFTVNVGTTPQATYTPTNAVYTASTGNMVLTLGGHNLKVGDNIKLADGALTFNCAMDGNYADKSYPRTTIDTHTASNAAYNPSTGLLTLTTQGHGMSNGDLIKIADNSLTFTCNEDNNGSNHTYPRSTDPISGHWMPVQNVTVNTYTIQVLDTVPSTNQTTHAFVSATANGISQKRDRAYDSSLEVIAVASTAHTVTGATYNPSTGVMQLTVTGHGFSNGDRIKLGYNSLTFSCGLDSNATQHSYPRTGDPTGGDWLAISSVATNTFEINVGVSQDTSAHTFVSAITGGLTKQSGDVTINVGASPTVAYTPTNGTYNPSNGDLELTIGTHNIRVGTSLKLTTEGVTFTCAQDSNATNHAYPRATIDNHTATLAYYTPADGKIILTVPGHGMTNGDKVKLDDSSLTFTCAEDSNGSNHSYPRPSDPISGKWIPISGVTTNTFEINVGSSTNTTAHTFISAVTNGIKQKRDRVNEQAIEVTGITATTVTVNVGASSNTTAHTFVSANQDSVVTGGNYAHTFKSATTGGVISGGSYAHTWISSATNGVHFKPNTAHTFVTADSNCVKNRPQTAHTFVRAAANCLSTGGTTFKVYLGQTPEVHTYVSGGTVEFGGSSYNITNFVYDNAVTGVATVTVSASIPNIAEDATVKLADILVSCSSGQKTYPSFSPPTTGTNNNPNGDENCKQDIVHFLNAVIRDLEFGSNHNVIEAAKKYIVGAKVSYVENEIIQTIRGIEYARELAIYAMCNWHTGDNRLTTDPLYAAEHTALTQYRDTTIINTTAGSPRCDDVRAAIDTLAYLFVDVLSNNSANTYLDAAYLISRNKDLIADQVLIDVENKYPNANLSDLNQRKCRRDVGLILGGLVRDLVLGGNSGVVSRAELYFTGTELTGIQPGMLAQTLYAYQKVKEYAINTLSNWTGYAGTHTFVSGVTNAITPNAGGTKTAAAGTTYNAATGDMVLEIGSHSLTTSNTLTIANGGVTFTCDLDANETEHAYPRATDPASGATLAITAVAATTVTVNVGAAINLPVPTTASAATYTANTGELTVTFPDPAKAVKTSHRLAFRENALKFTCDVDSNATQHSYPRRVPADKKAYGKSLPITNVSSAGGSTTVTVNVGAAGSASSSTHAFVSGLANGVVVVYDQVPTTSDIPKFEDWNITLYTGGTPKCANVASTIATEMDLLEDILDGTILPGATTQTTGTLYDTALINTYPDSYIYDSNNVRSAVRGDYDEFPIIEASPYTQNSSVISFLGGNGAFIDGAKVKQPNCPFTGLELDGSATYPNQGKSMVASAFTIVSFGGTGYKVINDGYVQLVSVFVIFCADGVLCESGGYASITNSATNFGQYALRGVGYSPTPYVFDIATISNVSSTPTGRTILTVSGLGREPLEHYVVKINGYTNTNADIEYFVDVVSAVTVGPPFSAQLTIDDGTGQGMDLTDVATGNPVSTSVLTGKTINLHRPSIVNSSSHTWEFAGSGTNYLALPENGGTKIEANEQVSQNYGRVYVSGTDELGDFKVGTFARIENRTGNITFTGTVTISEVEFLKLKGGDVVVTGFDDSNTLGGANASDAKLPTQKAVKDYITNNLGPYINKPYSTNAVPRALVELTDSGKISVDQIPALRPFSVYTVANQAARLALEGALAGDIAIQQDTSASFILNNDLTSLYLGFQFNAALAFTIGDIFEGSVTTGRIQSTEYRTGVVYQVNVTNNGSGYTVAPAVTVSGGNPGGGAIAASVTCTIANGEVVTATIVDFNGYIGGKGYTTAPTITFAAPPGAGTQAQGVALIESRLYGTIVNKIKIEDTDTFDDSTTPSANTVNINRVVNTSCTLASNWVSLSTNQIAAADITSGVIETDRLASGGAANSFTLLRGDSNWALAVQSMKGAENRYFAQLYSQATSGTNSLIFQTNQNALIGHEVKNTVNGIQANTNITGIVTAGGLTTVAINNPINQTIPSGTIIEFERGESPMTFESTYTQGNFVDDVIISNAGSGYTNGQYYDIPLTGGSGTGLKANFVVSSNAITDVTVTDGGSGYSADFAITVAPNEIGTGSGLVLEAKVSTVNRQYANVSIDVKRVTDLTISADLYGEIGVSRYKKAQFNIGQAGNGSVELKTGADSGLDADLLDGAQGAFYLNSGNQNSGTLPTDRLSGTYNISISGSSQNTIRLITGTNNPTSNPAPNNFVEGAIANTVFNSANGLADGGTRNLVMTIRNGGSGFDATYGGVRQLAFTDNDNMWIRGSGTGVSTFGSWGKVWTSLNDGVDSGLDADRLDNKQGDWYQNAYNLNSGTMSDNRLPGFISPRSYQDRLVIKTFSGDAKYQIYVQGLILNSSPFTPGNPVNLYNANAQAVGSYTIDAITINDDVNDNFNDYSILIGRLTSGNFTGALTVGTASNRVPFQDFTIEDDNTFEVTRLESSSGTALLKLGRKDGQASSPAVYFNSSASAATNYNVALIAAGGTTTDGSGTLEVKVANADGLEVNGSTVWNAGNITFQVNNIANTAVKRDGSGNFSAGTITATLTGASSLNVLKTGDTMTGTLAIVGGSSNLTVGGTSTFSGVTSVNNDLNVDSGVLFVDASANRVGINVGTAPSAALDLRSDEGIFLKSASNAPSTGARIRFTDASDFSQVGTLRYNHADSQSPNSNYGNTFTLEGTESELAFRVVGDVIASRKLGININREPNYTLEVDGDALVQTTLYIDDANDNGGASIQLRGSSSYRNFRLGNQLVANHYWTLQASTNNGGTTWNGTPAIAVDGSNNRVSINTTTNSGTDPNNNTARNYQFTVQGDMNLNGQFYQNNAEFVTSRWTESSNGNDIHRLSKVGINKSNPSYDLHVGGTSNFEGIGYINGDKMWIDTYGVFKANRNTVSENVTIPANTNCVSAGPITIANGYTVTINSGGNWAIV